MSPFRSMVDADIGGVFLNEDEFAERHEVRGQEALCVVESPTEQQMFQQSQQYSGFEVTHGQTMTLHIRKSDFGEVPNEGETFTLDGEWCVVETTIDDMGTLSILFHKNHA